ncbi:MAG: GAF domain-containing protein [Nitrospirota bacterium]
METTDKAELAILSEISRISNSYIELPQKLQRIIEVIARGMEKDGASVFLVDRTGKAVTLTAAIGLNQETVGKLTFPFGEGIAGWVAEQKVPLALENPFSDPRFQYVPETGIERFKSLTAAPIMDEDRCLGVIFVLSTAPWSATSSDITLLTTTANQISGVIKGAQLFQNIKDRLAELATIYEIGMALTSTLDLEQLLSLIATNTTQALRAQGCALRLMNLSGVRAPATAAPARYVSDAVRDVDARLGEAVAEKTAREGRPVLVEDAGRDPLLVNAPGAPPISIISVPLIFHDAVTGVIALYGRQGDRPFSEDDLQFLATIASTAAVAIENAAMYERMEDLATEARTRAQELAILYDIGSAMSATLNLDRLLRIILTAATMGGTGLGFNRAMLLLTNERTNTLQGMMGVGPASWDEAGRAWGEVSRKHKSLMEWIQTGELFEHRDSELNALARSIRVPLDHGEGVLALTVLEKKAFNILDGASSPVVGKELREALRVNSFATVPLIAKDKAIGVILVDNMFTMRPITDHDVRFLTMFAHQAALAIDNAIIHSNLETMNKDMRIMHEQLVQSEKMAALGAMMAEITHEIRNPLVSIGGFARRLARKVLDEDAKKYIDIILGEVTRLEGIIHDNLSYIKDISTQLQPGDLNAVVREVIALYDDELRQRSIALVKSLSESLSPVLIDLQQIKQAVINIVTNAMEAMENGGILGIRTYPVEGGREAAVEISDTGPGVSAEAMHNLFNPYYTTKARGTGLGLPITHRIVKAHRGTIQFKNKEAGGALFTIRIPYGPGRGA